MKAIDLYKVGLIMSGTDGDEEFIITGRANADQLFFVNKVLSDLNLPPVSSIGDELSIKTAAADAISAGIAYYIALRSSDKDRVEFLCDLYNAKRASAMSCITRVKSIFPFKN